MSEVELYDRDNRVVGSAPLPAGIFDGSVKPHLIQEVVVYQLAKRRRGTASTRTRREVRGSGGKPWRQKGTGRARVGAFTSPLWRGGGTIFGPKPRDYSYSVPKKVRRAALRSALNQAHGDGRLKVVREVDPPQPRTRLMADQLRKWALEGKTLIVVPEVSRTLALASRNLPRLKALPVAGLNVYDLLEADHVVVTPSALEAIGERLGP